MKAKAMKAKVPKVNENDWIRNPQPSYDAYSFDIKPSYDNPIYNMDIDELGRRGEQAHPIPQYAGLSGYSNEAKRKMDWYISKIKASKSEKEKKFYIDKLNAFKKSLDSGTSSTMANREKLLGAAVLFGIGYLVLNEILG